MAFRRSGSFVRFLADARGVEPEDPELLKQFKKRRFRSIEEETTEVESVGWVTPADPTGTSWRTQDIARGRCVFLKMRADKKSVPAAWLRIKLAEAERAEHTAGKRLTRARRQELKEEIGTQLLERVLPAVSLTDVVWDLERGQVFLFATSKRAQEGFLALWVGTFGGDAPPAVTPANLVTRSGLPGAALDAWERIAPVDLRPGATGARR